MEPQDTADAHRTDPLNPTGWPTDFDRHGLDDHDPRPAPSAERQVVLIRPDLSPEEIRCSSVAEAVDLPCYWPEALGFVVEINPGFRPYLPPGVRAERLDDHPDAAGSGVRYQCRGCGFDRLRVDACPVCESTDLMATPGDRR